jgi:putative MFS transporter
VFLLAAVPAVIVVLARRTIPETPGFLLSRGRVDEANASARWISGTDAVGEAAEPVTRPLRELVGPRYLRATMLAWLLWFSWSFSYFGITLWLPTLLVLAGVPLSHVLLYAVGFQLAAIAGRAVMLPVAGRFGPRPVIILMAAGAAGAVLWFGTLPGTVLLVVAGSLLSCCQDGGFSGIVPFTPDLYPVRLRATGVGTANGAGRLASLLAPLLVGALAESGDIHPVFVIFAAGYGLAALAAFCLGSRVVPVASGSGSRSGRGRG